MNERISITRGDVILSVKVTGRENGPVILLSNSLGAAIDMWEPQRAFLGDHFKVIGYDTRGHGRSSTPPGAYTFDDLTQDALAVLDHFDVQTADFIGLSLGGMTGLGLGLDHPDRFGKIVCACARADAPPTFAKSWDDRIAALSNGGMSAIWPGTVERWLTSQFMTSHPEIVEMLAADFKETTVAGYTGCARALQTLNYRNRLPEMTKPVLYISGANDIGAASSVMEEMANATPHAKYIDLPSCAHIANLNQSTAFNRALNSFLEI